MSQKLEPNHEGDFTFSVEEPFVLDSGGMLCPVTLHYAWYGAVNEARDNVIRHAAALCQ